MTDEELASYLVDNGASDEDVVEALRMRRTDPRQTARGMRPETRDDDPITLKKGSGEFRSISPSKERETQDIVRQIRKGAPGSVPDEAGAKQFVKDTSDPTQGGAIDPIAMMAMSGGLGTMGGALVSRLPVVSSLLQGGRLARPIGGAIVGASEGAAANAAAGGSPLDPLALIMGGAGRAGGKFAEATRAPGSSTGRAIENIKAVGGRPGGIVGRPARGGMFEEPGYRDLPEGAPGTEKLARESYGNIKKGMKKSRSDSKAQIDADEDAMVARSGDEPLMTHGTRADIAGMRAQRQGGSGPTEPNVDRFLEGVDQQLSGVNSKANLPLSARLAGTSANTAGELRNLQKSLNKRAADAKMTGDPAGDAAKQAAGTVRKRMREADPEFASSLDKYGSEQKRLRDLNQALHSSEGPIAPELNTKAKVATNKIKQAGKETDTAASAETDLRQAELLDPIAATQIPRVRGHNAAQSIDYTLSPGGLTTAGIVGNLLKQNADAASVRIGMPLGDMANRLTAPDIMGIMSTLRAELARMDNESSRGRKKQEDARR